MLRISKVSKLDGINSWSLQARETCPGSLDAEGKLVDACAGCYAAFGQYLYSNVKEPRAENKEDWKESDWEDRMVQKLTKMKYFRWFDSGDCYTLSLAKKMLNVMKRTPDTKHWLPTRMYKFAKFVSVFNEMNALPNVKVRFSSDSIMGEFVSNLHGSTILPDDNAIPEGVEVCNAYKNEGKCSGCRKCWDKEVAVIGYVAHGRVMKSKVNKKRIRLNLVA
jgi:hypothetical protein|nr:MAG: hypothetical protein [Caudoviricetes sp.]